MNVIEEIRIKLEKYPQANYQIGNHYVRVPPNSNDGFIVELIVNKNEYTVHFNGWHETFTDAEEALNCFAFGLSRDCRLKEYRRLGFAYKWTVEYKEDERWIEDSTTGLFLYPFWAKEEIKVLQNGLIPEKRVNE